MDNTAGAGSHPQSFIPCLSFRHKNNVDKPLKGEKSALTNKCQLTLVVNHMHGQIKLHTVYYEVDHDKIIS